MKILKKTTVAAASLITLLAAGCSDVTHGQLQNAEDACKDKHGVRMVRAFLFKGNVVVCGDDSAEYIEN